MGNTGLALLLLFVAAGCSKPEQALDPKQYIVVFKKSAVRQAVKGAAAPTDMRDTVRSLSGTLAKQHGLQNARFVYSRVLQGGVFHLEEKQLEALRNDPRVAYIEKDQEVKVRAVQSTPVWGLDRLDQADLPLDSQYQHDEGGVPVNVYVIDTGVLASHSQFDGRAQSGYDLVDKDADATDCDGHGTHVAGSIGSALYGVAKNVKIFGVRVLNCSGSGSYAGVIAGIEWVAANHIKPAVANMSLGGNGSKAVDDAVSAGIQAGVTFVVAAGNSSRDACSYSPARVPAAITVGASDAADKRARFSNFGPCIDVFAPGVNIDSLGIKNITDLDTMSGTSMASPHVAGVAALYLSRHPDATPAEVAAAVIAGSVDGRIADPGAGSPNKLANSRFLGGGAPAPAPGEPELRNGIPVNGLTGPKGDETHFVVRPPAGTKRVVVSISGGTGDADLYGRSGLKPTATAYSCRPYSSGNNETCTITVTAPGEVYVMVRAYSNYSGVTLSAAFE